MNTTITTPIKANSGAIAPTSKAMSWPVMVVPMLAPMITPTAWRSVIMPEFTKPTTITVVAEEDCITAVMTPPTSTPKMGLDVRRSKMRFIRLPAAASKPEPIICIPYRKSPRPPSSINKFVIVIPQFPLLSHVLAGKSFGSLKKEKHDRHLLPRAAALSRANVSLCKTPVSRD